MTNPCLLCGPGGGHDPGCIYDDERRMKMGIYDYVGGQYHPDSKTSTEGEPNCPSCASFAAQLEEARARERVLEAELQYEEQEKDLVLNRMAKLLNEKERMEQALRKIASLKPKEEPEWGGATDSGNYDEVEANGWDICAWGVAEIAEQALDL